MMNQKMTKAGKVLFLGSLLMTSVGLSPRHLMLVSNNEVHVISLATKTPMRIKVDGKLFEVESKDAPKVTEYEDVVTDAAGKVTKTVKKYDQTAEVTFKQLPENGTEACVSCIDGTTIVSGTSETKPSDLSLTSQVGPIQAAITKKLEARKLEKAANEKAEKEKEAKKDEETCAKIPEAIKKLHSDTSVARAACYILAADKTQREKGDLNSSFHWIELRNQIAMAARSNAPEDREFMSTMESWVNGSRVRLNDDKMVSEVSSVLIREIKESVVGYKTLAKYEAQNENLSRQLMAFERKFEDRERRYDQALEKEAQAMRDPRCSFNFMCWNMHRSATQRAMDELEKLRVSGGEPFERAMYKTRPQLLSAFEARSRWDGGIQEQDMDNYLRQFSSNAYALVDFTKDYKWLDQFNLDSPRNDGRLPYEMVGVRDANHGLQAPILGQGQVLNFAGRNFRGGSGGMPTMIAGGGRTNANPTSAFTSMQAFSGYDNRPYTGVNLGIPYQQSAGMSPAFPVYQPHYQTQQPMGQRYTFM